MTRRKSAAFYVETLLLVLFLLGILAVLVPMFTHARLASRQAAQLAAGVGLAQNATECLTAAQSPEGLQPLLAGLDPSFAWQEGGQGQLSLSAGGQSYRLSLVFSRQPTATGCMGNLSVAVYTAADQLVYTAEASRYWPGQQQGGWRP